jgi:hypothetical protein
MKKFSFLWVLLCIAMIANAQMDQGKTLISGGLGFSSSRISTETKIGKDVTVDQGATMTGMSFGVSAGFFVADNVAFGLDLGYTNAGVTTIPMDDQTLKLNTSLMMVAPSVSIFAEMGRDFYFKGTGVIGLGFGAIKTEFIDGKTSTINSDKINAFQLGFAPGFSYMLSDFFSLDLYWGFLGYQSQTTKTEIGTDGDYMHARTSDFGLNLDLSSLRLGISIQL